MKEKQKSKSRAKKTLPAAKRGRSKFGFRYNWRPELSDQRDFLFSQAFPEQMETPRSVDLRSDCPPVVNQGHIGSCTGNAIAGALEFLELRSLQEKKSQDPNVIYDPKKFDRISRLFIYFNEREIEGTTGQDAGANLRDGIKSLTQFGACRESLWKYLASNTLKKPSVTAYADGLKHTISAYLKIQSLDEMRQSLAMGIPFVFGFSVYESFESAEVARTGIVPMPAPNESLLGGHAVLAVGYDDSTHYMIVRNSWGDDWGDHGYFKMPYEYIAKSGLASDFWALQK